MYRFNKIEATKKNQHEQDKPDWSETHELVVYYVTHTTLVKKDPYSHISTTTPRLFLYMLREKILSFFVGQGERG